MMYIVWASGLAAALAMLMQSHIMAPPTNLEDRQQVAAIAVAKEMLLRHQAASTYILAHRPYQGVIPDIQLDIPPDQPLTTCCTSLRGSAGTLYTVAVQLPTGVTGMDVAREMVTLAKGRTAGIAVVHSGAMLPHGGGTPLSVPLPPGANEGDVLRVSVLPTT